MAVRVCRLKIVESVDVFMGHGHNHTFPCALTRAALTVVSHAHLPYHLLVVPVRPTETAPWQSREWIIALHASRTHHTHDNNYETQNMK